VIAAVPLRVLVLDEAQPGFVNEGGGLKSLAGSFAGEARGGELAEVAVYGRKQVFGLSAALLNRG